jgi:tetratricopeptide (TPR) repeat protein
MSTILEANGLKSKRNYQGALALYDKQWEIDQNSFTAWDLKNYAYCARKKSNYEQGIDICNYAYKIFPNFNKIDSDFYWCKFYTTLKCYPDNIEYEDKKELAIKIRDRFKEELSTDYKFTKENELIYFYPNYLKYYLYKANCYLNLEDYEKCFNQCFLGLRKYSNANGLYYYISKCIPKIYHLEGINLFNHLLALVGFEDDFVRDDYRNALISKSKLID